VDDLQELLAQADMYASTCTGQEEKYQDWLRRGYTWRWEDCVAAFQLVREMPNWWELVEAWRKEHKCRSCGFPIEHHAFSCRAR
jgi:hypothetical protein